MLGSLLKTAIMSYLEANRRINPSQHSFMSGRSCCTNLMEFMEVVTQCVDAGDPVVVIYLDITSL